MSTNTYNGWANYETWNVALWIGNTESLYFPAAEFMKKYKGKNPYLDFIKNQGLNMAQTIDGVEFAAENLDYSALNEMMREF